MIAVLGPPWAFVVWRLSLALAYENVCHLLGDEVEDEDEREAENEADEGELPLELQVV